MLLSFLFGLFLIKDGKNHTSLLNEFLKRNLNKMFLYFPQYRKYNSILITLTKLLLVL